MAVALALVAVASAAASISPLSTEAAATPDSGFTCTAGDTTLCLNNGRFQVTATFDTGTGQPGSTGLAHMVPVTVDTGFLWFFSSSNIEAVVKVLNGCGLNSRYWFFAGGLTDVKVVITVTDSQDSSVKNYTNPLHTPFAPIQDTSAFSRCL